MNFKTSARLFMLRYNSIELRGKKSEEKSINSGHKRTQVQHFLAIQISHSNSVCVSKFTHFCHFMLRKRSSSLFTFPFTLSIEM